MGSGVLEDALDDALEETGVRGCWRVALLDEREWIPGVLFICCSGGVMHVMRAEVSLIPNHPFMMHWS